MKIGSSITLLMVILIAFGYVISDDIQTHEKLNDVDGKINGLTSQLAQSESNLKLCNDQVSKDQQSLGEQDQKISELNATVTSLEFKLVN